MGRAPWKQEEGCSLGRAVASGQLPVPTFFVWNTGNSSQAPLELRYGQQSIIRSTVGPLHVLKMRGVVCLFCPFLDWNVDVMGGL